MTEAGRYARENWSRTTSGEKGRVSCSLCYSVLKWLLAVLITKPSWEEFFWACLWDLVGIHFSHEEGGSRRPLHSQLLPHSVLWLVGSWGKVVGTPGECLQTAQEAAKSLQILFPSWFLFSFPSSSSLCEGAGGARRGSWHSRPGLGEIVWNKQQDTSLEGWKR